MSRKAEKSAGLAVTVLAAMLYGCGGGGGDDDANSLNALQDAFGDAELTPAALTAQAERVNALQGALDALGAALPADHELSADTIMALVGMSDALAALTTANGGVALTPMALGELMDTSADLMALDVAAAAAGLDLTPMLIGALSNASEALAALTAANGGVELTPAALGELMTASDDLMALEAAAVEAGVDLTPVMIGALSAAADALAALTTANGGVALTPMRLGELIAASSSATELAGTLAGLMTVTVAAGVELTPAGLTALIGAAKALEALKAVDPGQTLDPAALEGLMATAAAHAALMAVAVDQGVVLTAASLEDFIAAYKDNVLVDVVGVSFRARRVAKLLVYAPNRDADGNVVDPISYLNSGGQMGPNDLPFFLQRAVEESEADEVGPGDVIDTVEDKLLDSYNVMEYVKVDSTGAHIVAHKDIKPAFAPDRPAPALGTATGGKAVWTGHIVSRERSGGWIENVVIYSDIMAPTPESFEKAYGGLNPGTAADKVESGDFNMTPAPGATRYEGITLRMHAGDPTATGPSTSSQTAFWKLVSPNPDVDMGDDFGGLGDPTAPADAGATFMGSFDGVPGTFECRQTARDCEATQRAGTDSSEPDRFISTEKWSFTADSKDTMVGSPRQDGDYLTLGFWLMEPDDARGNYSYAPYYAGRDVFQVLRIDGLTGKATYAGPAVGKYAVREFRSEEAYKGIFTADASLAVDFKVTGPGTVEGSISNFVSADGHNLGDWQVDLMETAINVTPAGPTDGEATLGVGVEGAANGRDFMNGDWDVQFFGNSTPTAPLTHPTDAAGQFSASWGTPEAVATYAYPGGPIRFESGEIGFVGLSGVFGAEKVK